jgi:DNA-binding NarL/FixJ family response regulator
MTISPSPSGRLVRVLIVDDMPQVWQDLGLLLTLTGQVEVVGDAANGLEAIRQVAALSPDVVLLDLAMPVLDGYAAAREIKARWPGCRVVALSVHSYLAARQAAALSGVDDFIEKGAPVGEILQKIGLSAAKPGCP